MGHTEYDDYTVLILIHFTRNDIGEREWDWTAVLGGHGLSLIPVTRRITKEQKSGTPLCPAT
jgi:hypothetical protein